MKALLAGMQAQAGASSAAAAVSRSERLAAAAVAALLGLGVIWGVGFSHVRGMAQRGARYAPLDGVSLPLALACTMPFLRRVLLAALFAGVLSGVFAAALHQLATVPLILEAEKYEHAAAPAAAHAEGHAASRVLPAPSESAHSHGEAWAPETRPRARLRTRLQQICWRGSALRC